MIYTLNLPNTDLLQEILKFIGAKSCIRFLMTCKNLYKNKFLIKQKIKKAKIKIHINKIIIPKQKYFKELYREWKIYMPHKYELELKFMEKTIPYFYYTSFTINSCIGTIPYFGHIIKRVIFNENSNVRLTQNHKSLVYKENIKSLELNIPTNKISQFKYLTIETLENVKYSVEYLTLDDFRKNMIERIGCIEVEIANELFLITIDGNIIKY